MKRKWIAGTLVVLITLPATIADAEIKKIKGTVIKGTNVTYSIEDVVEQLIDQDLQKTIDSIDPSLDEDGQQFQGEFSDQIEDIQDVQKEVEKKQNELALKMSAYRDITDYWVVEESIKLSEASAELAKLKRSAANKKLAYGLLSQRDVLLAEMEENNAQMSLSTAKQQQNMLNLKINQNMGKSMNAPLRLDEPETLVKLTESTYDAEGILDEVEGDHLSLRVYHEMSAQYQDILDDVEDLTESDSPSSGPLRSNLTSLQSEIAALQAKIEATVDGTDEENVYIYLRDTKMAQASIIEGQLNRIDVNDAQDDLDDYYSDLLRETQLLLDKQEDLLEFLSYQYEQKFQLLNAELERLETNVETTENTFELTEKLYEQGLITNVEVQEAKVNLLGIQNQLLNKKKEYMVLKEELRLFKEGYMPQG